MHVQKVQRYVISALILTTALHFVGGLLILAVSLGTAGAFWVLTIISTLVTLLAIAGVRLINQLPVLTPWLLVGVVPPIISFYFR